MDWTNLLYLVAAVLLVGLNGFFVLAEFALVKVRASRIEELARGGNRRAIKIRKMLSELDRHLSAMQLGITIASLALGWIGEPAFAAAVETLAGIRPESSPLTHTLSAVAAFVTITFLHILIGEMAPKSLAIRRAEQVALAISLPVRITYLVFYLPTRVLNGAAMLLLRPFGLAARDFDVAHSEQELRLVLSTAQASGHLPLNRLLMMENVFELGTQTVRDVMCPWEKARTISNHATREQIIATIREHHYTRYPVIDPAHGAPVGYLLTKDLLTAPSGERDWIKLVRSLRVVGPGDNLETTLQQLQREGANLAVVIENGQPVGLVTLEDILEEVVGRIEDEYPRLPRLFLTDALDAGCIVLDLAAQNPLDAICELAADIPRANLPEGVDVAQLAVDREKQMPTEIGSGVAVPHARCPGLTRPILALGRSLEGIRFNPQSEHPIRLVFLILTPSDRPHFQVFFLSQLAAVAESDFVRERLLRAKDEAQVIEIISAADPAVTG